MNIVIIGTGAIAGLFATLLSENNTKGSLSVKSREAKTGHWQFSFQSLEGNLKTVSIPYTQPSDIQAADIIISCVKSYDVQRAIASIAPHIHNNCSIVLCHNGLGTSEQISRYLHQDNRLYYLLTTMASRRVSAHHIQHTGLGENHLGAHNQAIAPAAIHQLALQLPSTILCDDIAYRQWQKLAINCAINPLTAIFDVTNGELAQSQYKETIVKTLKEVVEVAHAENISLDYQMTLASVWRVIELTAANSSSMREDIRNNRQTEIDFINGYIVNSGANHGIRTTVNKHLQTTIKRLSK
ncbi:ketopantoate reductase family protein [Thalassotalea maritima]|uniref:ketopantoate reductase family protein n=1 Tax=Thalassotalea maritima TaxID=3242416 RepID=UPI003528F556